MASDDTKDIREKLDTLVDKIDKLTMAPAARTKKSSAAQDFGPCCWVSYGGKVCVIKAQMSGFCNKHTLMLGAFSKPDGNCSTTSEAKVKPVSCEQLNELFEETVSVVEVILGGGRYQGYVSDDGIEVLGVMYYFKATKNGQRTNQLRVIKTTDCEAPGVAKAYGKNYCESCYSKLSLVPSVETVDRISLVAGTVTKTTAS